MTNDESRPAVAFVLKGYPRLSETFIAQEIHGLERAGLDIRLYSLRRPTDAAEHPVHRAIAAPVLYLPEYLHEAPLRVLAGWRFARRLPGYARALRAFRRDLLRDPTRNRVRRLGQALVLARELAPEVGHLHAHFLHTPASVARYASLLTGLPWSVSAHAKDIWTSPEWEKREKLAEVAWAVTCTAANHAHLAALAPEPARVELVYHGLDFTRLPPPPPSRPARDGGAGGPVRVLSVGRAVEKKGYDVLLEALARLPPRLEFEFVHVGGGPLAAQLRARAAALGLAARVRWLGPQAQQGVMREYARADLFVLASRIAADGDRDGLPNVLMEAQSQALACIATRISGVPELVVDGETGLLVPENDPDALAAALERLIARPELRFALGAAGAERVRKAFSAEIGLARLAERFGLAGEGRPEGEEAAPRRMAAGGNGQP